ncbi:hypothetical protein TNCV_1387231 [Trichonephila clavipes]|nr:hypothetical protein TNCV_1387231 [Trichonephila clavipes]
MKGKRKSLTSNIGRRSGLDVISRKRIRAQEDGTDVFDDYWSDSNLEVSKITNTSVTKVVNNEEVEEAGRECHSDALNIHKRTYDEELSTFLPDQRDKRVPKTRKWLSASFAGSAKSFGECITPKISTEKAVSTSPDKSQRSVLKKHTTALKSPSKPEQSPLKGARPTMPIEASRQEKSLSKPEHSPVTRGRSRKSPSKPELSPVMRGRPTMSIKASRQENSLSKPEQSHVMRGRPRMPIEASRQKSPSKLEQSPVKRARPTILIKASRQEKSPSNPEQLPVRRGRSRISVHQLKPEKSSSVPDESSARRKRPIWSETSPKKITKVTGNQLIYSRQKKMSAKVKAFKNKRAAPVDNNEVQSGFGENSMPIVKRKQNRMII